MADNTVSRGPLPLRSEFADDPDMAEIVASFVNEMPERVSKLQSLWNDQSLDELRRVAHQLKGASGGYGFATVGDAAGALESTLNALAAGQRTAMMESLRGQFESLVRLCQAVRA